MSVYADAVMLIETEALLTLTDGTGVRGRITDVDETEGRLALERTDGGAITEFDLAEICEIAAVAPAASGPRR